MLAGEQGRRLLLRRNRGDAVRVGGSDRGAVVTFNARKGSSSSPRRRDKGVRLRDRFTRMLWIAQGEPLPALTGAAAAPLAPPREAARAIRAVSGRRSPTTSPCSGSTRRRCRSCASRWTAAARTSSTARAERRRPGRPSSILQRASPTTRRCESTPSRRRCPCRRSAAIAAILRDRESSCPTSTSTFGHRPRTTARDDGRRDARADRAAALRGAPRPRLDDLHVLRPKPDPAHASGSGR